MSEKKKIFHCNICGNQVELVLDGGGELICCGESMQLLEGTSPTAADEKHNILCERTENGIKVTIGEPRHPMTPGHLIQWIECAIGNKLFRRHLTPDDEPEAEFICEWNDEEKPVLRAYCNAHGMCANQKCNCKTDESAKECCTSACS